MIMILIRRYNYLFCYTSNIFYTCYTSNIFYTDNQVKRLGIIVELKVFIAGRVVAPVLPDFDKQKKMNFALE